MSQQRKRKVPRGKARQFTDEELDALAMPDPVRDKEETLAELVRRFGTARLLALLTAEKAATEGNE
jgi:hypothetical protein